MKKKSNLIKVLALAMIILLGAESKKASAQFFTGGDMNVTFLGGVNVDIAPIVGYKIKSLSVGVSPILMYTAAGNTSGNYSYGGRLFLEYTIIKGLFAHVEAQALNTGYMDWTTMKIRRNWVIGAPMGIGYETELAPHVSLKTTLLFDPLLEINLNQSSPLSNPSVRAGITYTL
jgi:hypothetical protein